ncbi:IS5 family transposase [Nocardia anaemiae]|uniref:IS5 family transposase n=1 Tax=Nocardia anaemiae TaxID=263910 RepID=UPI0007A4A0CF|nr:IS5 family transposase [Nocardia anaemiae]
MSPVHPCPVYPSSCSDEQWALLEPLLPPPGNTGGKGGRAEKHPRRLVLDAVFYMVRGGIAWRALPNDFPPPTTVYDIFCRWTKAGVWQRINDVLRERIRIRAGRKPTPTAAIIDSQSVRGADTVPTRSRGWDNGKKVGGRKRHIAVDTMGLLLAVVVTAASIQDRDGAVGLLALMRERFFTITLAWADAGYTGRLVIWAEKVLHLAVAIVKRTDPGFVVLPRRWVVERSFAWISKHRRCVRDYETLPTNHEAMVYIAMIMTMSRRLTRP